ncbi:hypothetical protein PVAND_015185 [Polypedilum vanderplanki]|uniref:Uncharacterized protein n=1 Tax=Polypedilum vanderplanki TaxID=319348 RepID=A0A9J6BBF3_POLVA|nr:hypothetical protein PVAND_015185 [Polypedilum vanderplanki]
MKIQKIISTAIFIAIFINKVKKSKSDMVDVIKELQKGLDQSVEERAAGDFCDTVDSKIDLVNSSIIFVNENITLITTKITKVNNSVTTLERYNATLYAMNNTDLNDTRTIAEELLIEAKGLLKANQDYLQQLYTQISILNDLYIAYMDGNKTICQTTTTSSTTTNKATDAPATNVPMTDAPGTNAPMTDAPVTNMPMTDAPVTNVPMTDAPAYD